jgi:cytochrome P450
MLHDPKFFFSPSQFLPERFLEDERSLDGQWVARLLSPAEDPIQIAFGFGRRSVIRPFLSLGS